MSLLRCADPKEETTKPVTEASTGTEQGVHSDEQENGKMIITDE
jgi:hypothetical protein